MFEQFILGTIQGITEWLPVSSKSLIILAQKNLFNQDIEITAIIRLALLLHLGTFMAAVIHFRKDVLSLLSSFFNYKDSSLQDRKLFQFLLISTIISGSMAFAFYKFLESAEGKFDITGSFVSALIGTLLIFTGLLQIKSRSQNKEMNMRTVKDSTIWDAVILGFTQGFAAIPGFSRSGLTVGALLLRRFDDMESLRISFLMSLPIVLAGNIVLNLDHFGFYPVDLVGIGASFFFGLLTIRWLLELARKVNFGKFVIGFGVLLILSGFI